MAGTTATELPRTPVPAVHRLARGPVALITAAVAFAHLATAFVGSGYFLDEAMTVVLGRHHLDWGSADQPPLAPALAWLADLVAPGSLPVLRIVPALATAAAVVVAALVARELGGDGRTQTLTALVQATGLYTTFVGHWITPYTFEPLQWLIIVWLLVRWIRVRDDRLLLVLGPVLGIAAVTRFQVIAFGAALVVALLAVGPRDLLRRPVLWVAVLVGALTAMPTLVWQAAHRWPQLAMSQAVAQETDLYGGRLLTVVGLVAMAGVLGTVLLLISLVAVWTEPGLRPYRFLAITYAVLYVVFVVTAGRHYYLDGLHAPLAALGALALQHRRDAGARRLSRTERSGAVLSIAAALGMLAYSVNMANVPVRANLIAEVGRVWSALPAQEQERTAVVTSSYIWAAYIDTADPELGLPRAYSGNRSYGYLDPPADDRTTVLYVGDLPAELAAMTTGMRRVGGTAEVPVHLGRVTGRTWSQAWPQLRTLPVTMYPS
ncbi:glycosyltransferase family 39 protein [Pseudonocardia lacus]|uniref:glycosyltransferase family 39 protein n=1 Tax=Pseudonocardia lacus TaxID=2835865 RepID=UPI001BDD5D83|nr:glycosyltransferase family 39 protein [Pseudonocardia lacus]